MSYTSEANLAVERKAKFPHTSGKCVIKSNRRRNSRRDEGLKMSTTERISSRHKKEEAIRAKTCHRKKEGRGRIRYTLCVVLAKPTCRTQSGIAGQRENRMSSAHKSDDPCESVARGAGDCPEISHFGLLPAINLKPESGNGACDRLKILCPCERG